jgi:DNA-binding NarL/FixJ family response regulator
MNSPITVCIVEDIEEICLGLERILHADARFRWLASFRDAETAAKELPSLKPDLVVMDINLPGMNGIDCIRNVSARCPSIQFMMFTIYENSEHVFEALAAGASGYLLKNTPPEKITEALLELHAGGSPMSAHIARKVVTSFQKTTPGPEAALLSGREREVLEYLAKGYLYKEIADVLSISTGTVRQHIHKIYEKLHVQNRTEAINKVYGKH